MTGSGIFYKCPFNNNQPGSNEFVWKDSKTKLLKDFNLGVFPENKFTTIQTQSRLK